MSASAVPAPPAAEPPRVKIIFAALMLVLLLAALDQTIVSTALPTIVGDLGGVSKLSWVVTAYLLSSTIAGPLYGKLGDLYGRKILLQIAIVIFLAGSVLCGLSSTMAELIAFRAVQGLGGGGLMVVTLAVVGDIIPPRDRGRYQGLFGAVFGVSTVIGPLLGGFFVDSLTWRWIFFVNLPVGALALGVIAALFRSRRRTVRHRIDYPGAALLAGGLSAVVLYTSMGGTTYPWGAPGMMALIVGGALLLLAFVVYERRPAEPLVPLVLFRNRVVSVACAITFVTGLSLFGAVTFVPLYLQTVKGHTPTVSGLLMSPMMGGVLITSIASGRTISRIGRYRPFPIAGTAVMTVGLFLLSRLDVGTRPGIAALYVVVVGLGVGMVNQVVVLATQNAVDYEHIGVASSTVTLFRSVGASIGVAIFGAIFASRLASGLVGRLPADQHMPTTANPDVIRHLPAGLHVAYVDAATAALHPIFRVGAVVAALAFALSWLLREVPLRATSRVSAGAQAAGEATRDPDSLRVVERSLTVLARREERWPLYEGLAARAGIDLAPPELWLLARIGACGPVSEPELLKALPVDADRLREILARLREHGRVADGDGVVALTPFGAAEHDRLVVARRDLLSERLDGHHPDDHPELQTLLDDLARDLVRVLPSPPGA